MEKNLVKANMIAGEDLTGKEYYCVRADGKLTTATGEACYGVISVGDASGSPTEVVTGGEYWVMLSADGDVSANDFLTAGADGKALAATNTPGTQVDIPFGIALEDAVKSTLCRVLIR